MTTGALQGGVRVVGTSRVEVDADAGTVRFKPLMETDEGTYNCTATNDVGSDSAVGQLLVSGGRQQLFLTFCSLYRPDFRYYYASCYLQ